MDSNSKKKLVGYPADKVPGNYGKANSLVKGPGGAGYSKVPVKTPSLSDDSMVKNRQCATVLTFEEKLEKALKMYIAVTNVHADSDEIMEMAREDLGEEDCLKCGDIHPV